MNLRIVKPPRPIAPKKLPDPVGRREALARAEKVARAASARADGAWLDALHPIERAHELRRREIAAERDLAEVRQEVTEAEFQPRAIASGSMPAAEMQRRQEIEALRADAERQLIDYDFDAAFASGALVEQVRHELAIATERHRVSGFQKLCAFGARNGVNFDAVALIADGTSLEAARDAVCEAMAAESERLAINSSSPHPTATQASAAQGWDAALRAVLANHGIEPRASR